MTHNEALICVFVISLLNFIGFCLCDVRIAELKRRVENMGIAAVENHQRMRRWIERVETESLQRDTEALKMLKAMGEEMDKRFGELAAPVYPDFDATRHVVSRSKPKRVGTRRGSR